MHKLDLSTFDTSKLLSGGSIEVVQAKEGHEIVLTSVNGVLFYFYNPLN
jgi:hypothetical protein